MEDEKEENSTSLTENPLDLSDEKAKRSIVVSNFPENTQPNQLYIHFQQERNFGGEVEKVFMLTKEKAVVVFDEQEVAEKVLKKEQHFHGVVLDLKPYVVNTINVVEKQVFSLVSAKINPAVFNQSPDEIKELLANIASDINIQFIELCDGFWVSGTYSQIQKTCEKLSSFATPNGARNTAPSSKEQNGMHEGEKEPEPFVAQVQPELMYILRKGIQQIEEKYSIRIDHKAGSVTATLSPLGDKDSCQKGTDEFIELYQKNHQMMEKKTFDLVTEEAPFKELRKELMENLDVAIERKDNQVSIYGRREHVLEAMQKLQGKPRRGRKPVMTDSANDVLPRPDIASQTQLSATLTHTLENGINITVYQGDLTKQHVDAIVNAANERLDHCGGLAGAVVKQGGYQIQQESTQLVQRLGRVPVGKVAHTSSGNLPCKTILHAVGPRWSKQGPEHSRQLIHDACLNSLMMAHKFGLRSIAIPAISSGIFGVPVEICAEMLFAAAEMFSCEVTSNNQLKDIRFVNIDTPTNDAIRREFCKRYVNQTAYNNQPGTGDNSVDNLHKKTGERSDDRPPSNSASRQERQTTTYARVAAIKKDEKSMTERKDGRKPPPDSTAKDERQSESPAAKAAMKREKEAKEKMELEASQSPGVDSSSFGGGFHNRQTETQRLNEDKQSGKQSSKTPGKDTEVKSDVSNKITSKEKDGKDEKKESIRNGNKSERADHTETTNQENPDSSKSNKDTEDNVTVVNGGPKGVGGRKDNEMKRVGRGRGALNLAPSFPGKAKRVNGSSGKDDQEHGQQRTNTQQSNLETTNAQECQGPLEQQQPEQQEKKDPQPQEPPTTQQPLKQPLLDKTDRDEQQPQEPRSTHEAPKDQKHSKENLNLPQSKDSSEQEPDNATSSTDDPAQSTNEQQIKSDLSHTNGHSEQQPEDVTTSVPGHSIDQQQPDRSSSKSNNSPPGLLVTEEGSNLAAQYNLPSSRSDAQDTKCIKRKMVDPEDSSDKSPKQRKEENTISDENKKVGEDNTLQSQGGEAVMDGEEEKSTLTKNKGKMHTPSDNGQGDESKPKDCTDSNKANLERDDASSESTIEQTSNDQSTSPQSDKPTIPETSDHDNNVQDTNSQKSEMKTNEQLSANNDKQADDIKSVNPHLDSGEISDVTVDKNYATEKDMQGKVSPITKPGEPEKPEKTGDSRNDKTENEAQKITPAKDKDLSISSFEVVDHPKNEEDENEKLLRSKRVSEGSGSSDESIVIIDSPVDDHEMIGDTEIKKSNQSRTETDDNGKDSEMHKSCNQDNDSETDRQSDVPRKDIDETGVPSQPCISNDNVSKTTTTKDLTTTADGGCSHDDGKKDEESLQEGNEKKKIESTTDQLVEAMGGLSLGSDADKPSSGENHTDLVPSPPAGQDDCGLCNTAFSDAGFKVILSGCGHMICQDCKVKYQCKKPFFCGICGKTAGCNDLQPPGGKIVEVKLETSLSGFEGHGTIAVDYEFFAGIQGSCHPNPGHSYDSLHRRTFLPDTPKGKEVKGLFEKAFNAGALFTIKDNKIEFTDEVDHKYNIVGGQLQSSNGYPDPDYLDRVTKQLHEILSTKTALQTSSTQNTSDQDQETK